VQDSVTTQWSLDGRRRCADLEAGSVRILAHRLVEADDVPAELAARAVSGVVSTEPAVRHATTGVLARRPGALTASDVDVDRLAGAQDEAELALGFGQSGRPDGAKGDHLESTGGRPSSARCHGDPFVEPATPRRP